MLLNVPLAQAEEKVKAITYHNAPGFFVPSSLFREMDKEYSVAPNLRSQIENLESQVYALRVSNIAFARSSSTTLALSNSWRDGYLRERKAREEAEKDLREASPSIGIYLICFGVGVAVTLGAILLGKSLAGRTETIFTPITTR